MNEIERELVEEYKKLDLLLKDKFNSETGVSEYIARMDDEVRAFHIVDDWERDYRKLKHIRHVRNKIMHDEDDSFCEESDIDFAEEFYDRVLGMDDPLSRLHELREKAREFVSNFRNETSERRQVYDAIDFRESRQVHDSFDSKEFFDEDQEHEESFPNTTTVILLVLLMITCIVLLILVAYAALRS